MKAGDRIDGAFTLLRPIGEGGMGEVWLGREDALGRDVAVKFMRESPDPARAVRFGREARALAALDHPSILPVLRTGIDPASGLRYLTTPAILLSPDEMRRICDDILHCPYPGRLAALSAESSGEADSSPPSTAQRSNGSTVQRPNGEADSRPPSKAPLSLSDLLDGGKALPEAAVLRLARDVAVALAAAHRAGIVHRDVKPSNILYDASGRAILADFGLAKFTRGGEMSREESPEFAESPDGRVRSRAETFSLSVDSAGRRKFLGSPAYAAPEQFDPDAGPDTPALDWYAFGAVLYRALTGRRPGSPRKASSFDPRHLSRAWDPLLDALLEPDPAKRLADPAAVLRGLRRVERLPAPRRIARNLVAFWSLCLLAGLAAGLAIYGPRRLREKIGGEADSSPPSTVRRSDGSTVQRPNGEADSGPLTPPQPVPGILGLVQSPAFTNPVTDFSVPDTERGLWIPTRKWQIPAGTENFLPVGAETNRLRFVWCPVPADSPEAPDPSLAPGFWILDRPVSLELAALVLNHLAESRSDPVARPEDPRRGEWPAAIGGEAIEPLLVSMTRFAGIPIDLLAFSVPTPGQLLVAENVLREHGGTLPSGDVWTSDLLSLAAPPGSSFMNLQPVLRPYPNLSR